MSRDLISLVQRGSKSEVQKLFRMYEVNINEADSDGTTAVMEAAANNHISILTLLLENKASIDQVNRLGRNALMEAACRGHPAIVLRLCQSRPQLNYQNPNHPLNPTALMEAASRGHDGVTFWLCEARADVNKINRWGDTALIMAAHNNRLECVKILVSQRAVLDIEGDAGLTALETAIRQGHMGVIEFLSDPKIRESQYLLDLYSKFKVKQKEVLQDEVNYDASPASRLIETPDMPLKSVAWEEVYEPIAEDIPEEEMSLKRLFHTDSILVDGDRLYEIPHNMMHDFQETHWIAVEPTRTSHNSRAHKIEHSEHILQTSADYPILTLHNDMTWSYIGDSLSGELGGPFEIFKVMTHANLDVDPKVTSPSTSKLLHYLVRLTTCESVDPHTNEHIPVQVVSFVLDRNIVLGRLVLSMPENETPWWVLHEKSPSANHSLL